jgi:ArsR family transcriptional regulator
MSAAPAPANSFRGDPTVAAALLRLLANERRLLVLCALRQGELSVGKLAETVGLSQSALSQHLSRLRSAGAVATRREGQTIHYRIADREVMTLIEAVAEVVGRRAARL